MWVAGRSADHFCVPRKSRQMSNSKSQAYVDTTVLADALLKPGSPKQSRALAALARYEETLLPVYSIKELKVGALGHYAWLHDKFVQTKSLADTVQAMSSINPHFQGARKSTAWEAFAAATRLLVANSDEAGGYASRTRKMRTGIGWCWPS